LEQENQRLKQIVANLTLDKHVLKDVQAKSGNACRSSSERALTSSRDIIIQNGELEG
jgi:putative transposase